MIPLYVNKGVAYVWNADGMSLDYRENTFPIFFLLNWNANNFFLDWHTLRTTHRICGALIGSLPPFPRQNDFQGSIFIINLSKNSRLDLFNNNNFVTGLPMALMSVEAAFLVEKGICELIELPNINDELSPAQKQQIKKMEEGYLYWLYYML